MSILLYALGIVSAVAGAVAILFGIPVKEFSFGDTLIGSGVTAVVGGLAVVGLGAAVAQLQRIAELLGARPLARAGQPIEPAVRIGNGPGRVPFPPKPKLETSDRPTEMPVVARTPARSKADVPPPDATPLLPNPDVPMMEDDEARHLPLSPREAATQSRGDMPPTGQTSEPPHDAPFGTDWRVPPAPSRSNYFEKTWQSEELKSMRSESIPRVPEMHEEGPAVEESQEDEQGAPVAVLKSGVVDGMGYTLFVDGSIEAELPDGTLRFASINELRAHLEKNS